MMRLVTVAHGTRDPDGAPVIEEITRRAGECLRMPSVASYVELQQPLLTQVLGESAPSVVVPLLLSRGHHVAVDVPAAIATASTDAVLGAALGPDPRLASAMADRLREAGALRGRPVVMVAAGSRDLAATRDLVRSASMLAGVLGSRVRWATLSGAGPRPGEVIEPGDVVAPYLLAPGFFARRARAEAEAAGAAAVADVIGAHPRVIDLVARRAAELVARRQAS